jgi:predicted nucleic acid-binding protein
LILLDTNVLSEALRTAPSLAVVRWLDRNFADCAISSVTIFELFSGVALLSSGRRRETLETTVARTVRRFGPRVYPFDSPAAQASARLFERARSQGMGPHQLPGKLADLQIAGIASAYGLLLATRNVRDFQGLGLDLIDPWSEAAD